MILESSPLFNNVSPLATLATPYGALEVLAYGLAMSRSGILIYQIAKSQWREYVVPTIIEMGTRYRDFVHRINSRMEDYRTVWGFQPPRIFPTVVIVMLVLNSR